MNTPIGSGQGNEPPLDMKVIRHPMCPVKGCGAEILYSYPTDNKGSADSERMAGHTFNAYETIYQEYKTTKERFATAHASGDDVTKMGMLAGSLGSLLNEEFSDEEDDKDWKMA